MSQVGQITTDKDIRKSHSSTNSYLSIASLIHQRAIVGRVMRKDERIKRITCK
jgi:hypothetical protein